MADVAITVTMTLQMSLHMACRQVGHAGVPAESVACSPPQSQ